MVDQDCVLSALRVEGNELPHPYTHGFGHVLILASRSCTSAQPRAPSSMPFSVSVMSSFPCPIQPWVANCPHRGILLLRHAQASPICCGGGSGLACPFTSTGVGTQGWKGFMTRGLLGRVG